MSLNMNSPVKFQAIGLVDKLHLTTSGVVKKNDHVMAKVTIPISEPMGGGAGEARGIAGRFWPGAGAALSAAQCLMTGRVIADIEIVGGHFRSCAGFRMPA
jgi:hypothetical protein